MIPATALRFDAETRIELRSGLSVRPVQDRFCAQSSREKGPAGVFVYCDFSFTYSDRDVRRHPNLAGLSVWRPVFLASVASIRGATIEGNSR